VIVVRVEGDLLEIPDGTRYVTDEHNNLCIYTGRQGDRLTHLIHRDHWQGVEVVDDDAS
jgi:hypothetical protein